MAKNSKKRLHFNEVDSKVEFPKLEDSTVKYWQKNKIFEKSVDERSKDNEWTFLDGPPFITGLPHYGSLLSSIPKDVFPRYKTMKGHRVRRVWGWDCHGLPAENKVEKKLGIKTKREIEEKVGVKKFIEECKAYVSETSSEWEWYVDHIGRWVDFKNAYKTMDTPYMESVMWVFKKMYEKGHIYKGLRVSLYCPHCETPISNFEVAMDADNYKDVAEFATTYKYKVKGEKNTYFLAWSTTPWNKIATPALAINPKLTYVKVEQEGSFYILAKGTLKILKEKPKHKIVEEFKGEKLVGMKFEPHFDYYKSDVKKGEKAFVIVPADFVSAEEGTGIVTLAAYGEDDLEVMEKEKVHKEMHVGDDGHVKKDVPVFGGMYYLKANKLVDEDLEKRGLVYKKENLTHSLPHCWRCATRLFHNPQNAWYVNIQDLKPSMKKNNEDVNWVPSHFKNGRFLKSMESAPDWNISRSRYWGSPVPVWECECGERHVPGSIKELEEMSGEKITDLHKPGIDEVTVKCEKCGEDARRVSEVLDSWIEAGSASFAERHFPFEKGDRGGDAKEFFPPDFITEYTGQIRAWFYVLHVIGTALYDSPAFKNVVVTGVILGTDGRKMSKNFGNYPDPKMLIEKYGGDALRLYLMGSPVMKGEDIVISEEDYKNYVRSFLLPLWNVYNFFVTYANAGGWSEKDLDKNFKPKNVLDKWILSRMNVSTRDVENAYEKFDTQGIVSLSLDFLSDLSNWYVRRSRERFSVANGNQGDKNEAFQTLYTTLTTITRVFAPMTPFVAETIYRNLTKEKSVHLTKWPKIDDEAIDEKLEEETELARKVVEIAHSIRKEKEIPVRQALSALKIKVSVKISDAALKVIGEEINVLEVVQEKGDELSAELDTKITPELKELGKARKLIRDIQIERKELGTALDEKVSVSLPDWPKEHEEEIMRKALVKTLKKGEFKVSRVK